MNYQEATIIARYLSNRKTKAARLLRTKMRELDRESTFIIMRYGDPRQWRRLPISQDRRQFRYRTKYTRIRPCHLMQLDGRSIKAKSIAEFCDKAGLDKNARFHLSPVLDGHRAHHKKWFLPSFLAQVLKIKDIYGNVYEMTVRDWMKRGYSARQAYNLLTGKKRSTMESRVMLADTPNDAILKPNPIRTTQVKLTDGKRVFTGRNVNEAARIAGLSTGSNLYPVAYGFKYVASGLRLKSVKIERKKVLV